MMASRQMLISSSTTVLKDFLISSKESFLNATSKHYFKIKKKIK